MYFGNVKNPKRLLIYKFTNLRVIYSLLIIMRYFFFTDLVHKCWYIIETLNKILCYYFSVFTLFVIVHVLEIVFPT